ncbi:hypothetical protein FCY57_25200, partial [Escherichia coli]|nr:hypothetical protein [Escherichia coli]
MVIKVEPCRHVLTLLPVSGQELPIRWLAQHGSEKPVTHVSR